MQSAWRCHSEARRIRSGRRICFSSFRGQRALWTAAVRACPPWRAALHSLSSVFGTAHNWTSAHPTIHDVTSAVILSAAKDLCPLKMHPANYLSAHPYSFSAFPRNTILALRYE